MIIKDNNPYIGPSFSLANRFARFAWELTWLLFFRPSPRLFHAWRNALLRIFGASVGQHVHIHPDVRVWAPWKLHVGSFVGIGRGTNIYNMGDISIGDYAVISQGTHLCGGSHDHNASNFQLFSAPISIGPRTWLCADSFVGPGVAIPTGVVVGARSVVVKTIGEPWTVWCGMPARKVGIRNVHKAAE